MEKKIEEISGKLDVIIQSQEITNRLLGFLVTAGMELGKEKVLSLLDAGFKPKEVSNLLNIPIGSVTKARSRALGKTEH